MRSMLWLAAGVIALTAAPVQNYLSGIKEWRADREAKLKTPDGWLSVAGLFWLRDGESVVGSDPLSDVVLREGLRKRAGVLRVQAGTVTFEPTSGEKSVIKSDVPGPPDVVKIGSVAMTIIKRGDRTGARLKDPDAPARQNFTGCKWFPVSERWNVKAKWTAYPAPKTIKIVNVLGMTLTEPAPGFAEFTLAGKQIRLEPIQAIQQIIVVITVTRRQTIPTRQNLQAPQTRRLAMSQIRQRTTFHDS